mgnify:CR=1 FL=1
MSARFLGVRAVVKDIRALVNFVSLYLTWTKWLNVRLYIKNFFLFRNSEKQLATCKVDASTSIINQALLF